MDLITEFLFDRDRRVSYQEDLLKKNKNKTETKESANIHMKVF